jgi:hypothetical protein
LFWRGTLIPILRSIGGTLTLGLKDEYPDVHRWGFDVSKIQALQEDEDKKFTRWLSVLEAGVATREEVRVKLGLPEEPEQAGTYLISTRVIPTPSDMPALGIPPGLTPLEAGKEDAVAANEAEQGLTDQQRAELLPGEGGKALPAARTNGVSH